MIRRLFGLSPEEECSVPKCGTRSDETISIIGCTMFFGVGFVGQLLSNRSTMLCAYKMVTFQAATRPHAGISKFEYGCTAQFEEPSPIEWPIMIKLQKA